ncbi:MAG: hypothetical protein A4E65_02586 [Syntrophorhabdus sp. PtaU1.Bin153]|nr:MAG: hypothetical protein A4E65_02586 [Syntrophorhabdus sp. PtaU1.Bin153]
MGELYVCAPDYLNGLYDPVRIVLQLLLKFLRNSEHRGRTERIPCMDAHGIDVFNEADGNHVVFGVSDDLEFQFFPSQDCFFNQNLAYEACRYSPSCNCSQFFFVVSDPPSCAAQGIGRPYHYRISKPVCDREGLVDTVGGIGDRNRYTEFVHGILEFNAVFAPFDGIRLDAYDPDVVFCQDSLAGKFRRKIEPCLASKVREKGLRFFLFDNFLYRFDGERFNICGICCAWVGHDRGGIRVYENDLIACRSEGLACLSSRIVELACLPDNDGTGSYYQDFIDAWYLVFHGCACPSWENLTRASYQRDSVVSSVFERGPDLRSQSSFRDE